MNDAALWSAGGPGSAAAGRCRRRVRGGGSVEPARPVGVCGQVRGMEMAITHVEAKTVDRLESQRKEVRRWPTRDPEMFRQLRVPRHRAPVGLSCPAARTPPCGCGIWNRGNCYTNRWKVTTAMST